MKLRARTTKVGGLLVVGVVAILNGIAGLSTSAAWIVGGLLAIAAAVGYFRGPD